MSIVVILIFLLLALTQFNALSPPPNWMGKRAIKEYADYMYFGGGMDNNYYMDFITYVPKLFTLNLQGLGILFLYNLFKDLKGTGRPVLKRVFIAIVISVIIKILLYFLQVKYKIYMYWIDSLIIAFLALDIVRAINKNDILIDTGDIVRGCRFFVLILKMQHNPIKYKYSITVDGWKIL